MLNEEFEKLKSSESGLLAFNNFLSTTKDRTLAYGFAFGTIGSTDMVGILFQMTIDPEIKSSPFASIENFSHFQGDQSEEEILFSMCTVFRIGQIKQLVSGIWQVDLQLTHDDDPQLHQLTQYIRNEVSYLPGLLRLGHLMHYLGEWNQAEAFFATLGQVFCHKKDILSIMHSNVGQILAKKGDLDKALFHQQMALQIQKTLSATEQQKMHFLYNNMGDIFLRKAGILAIENKDNGMAIIHLIEKALVHFKYALNLAMQGSKVDRKAIAVYHNNIGDALKSLGRIDEALDSFNRCLEIELELLPSTHFSLATSYNNIASVSYYNKNYDKALSSYQQCLTIQRRSLPSKHPMIAETCSNISIVYESKHDYKEASKYAKEALDIAVHCFSSDHDKLQLYHTMYNNICQKM
jgi:tetratricopeptide (TPR) repeat protein